MMKQLKRMWSGTVLVFGHPVPKKALWSVAGGLCAVALAVSVVLGTCHVGHQEAEEPARTVTKSQSYKLNIGVRAEGWNKETSSPVIAHIMNNGEKVDYYHAYDANEPASVTVPSKTGYTVSFLSPVDADGGTYRVPSAFTVKASENGVTDKKAKDLPFAFTPVQAKDVKSSDLEKLLSQVTEAVRNGDKTLSAENGTKLVQRIKANMKSNPNANDKAVDKAASEAEKSSKQEDSKASTNTNQKTGKSDNGTTTAKKTQSTTSNGGSGKKNTGSSAATGGSTGGTHAHVHTWVAQTTTVHHPAQYRTVHHDAVYTTVHHDAVYEERSICNNCGKDITGQTTQHMKESLLSGGHCGSYHSEQVQVSAAWDEQVQVSAAWDEQVQTQAAYDETVTTGYVCSGCGARK